MGIPMLGDHGHGDCNTFVLGAVSYDREAGIDERKRMRIASIRSLKNIKK